MEEPGAEALLRALSLRHIAPPAAAHAVAQRYRGLGALMDALLDPGRCVGVLGRVSAHGTSIEGCRKSRRHARG